MLNALNTFISFVLYGDTLHEIILSVSDMETLIMASLSSAQPFALLMRPDVLCTVSVYGVLFFGGIYFTAYQVFCIFKWIFGLAKRR